MPINGPSSYPQTTNEFIAHWKWLNDELAEEGPFILKGGVAVADLEALRDELLLRRAAVEEMRNGREGGRAILEAKKALLLSMLNRFNAKMTAVAEGVEWLPMLPFAFSQSDGMAKVIQPLDDMADVWRRYDEANAPQVLTIRGGTTRADFNAELEELKGLYAAYPGFGNALDAARAKRTETEEAIHPILVSYRKTIAADYDKGSVPYLTMPRLTPLPGSTPDAVVLSGALDETGLVANLAWTPPTGPDVVELELRATVGPEFDTEDETVLASFAPGAPPVWSGTFGLGVPGSAASFKIYSITATGNERGSNTVTLERPVEP